MTDTAKDLFSVEDQVAIVSGASRGIGLAIARGFVERGARVAVTGRDPITLEQACETLSGKHSAVPIVCDVSKPEHIDRLAEKVIDQFGRIDTLVNVAGVNRRRPAEQITENDYDFVMNVNLKGTFLLSQVVGRQMIEQKSGTQINIGSLNNFRPVKGVAPYAMSKAGVGHMTHILAMEWGEHNVRVNCIAPGFILTDLTSRLWSEKHMQDWVKPNTPLRRLGKPEDMVGTAIFLASEASAFMTGQILYVDGGVSCGINWPIDYHRQ